jgi:hypothetical protein
MPPINFPDNPVDGDLFDFAGRIWIYAADIPAWVLQDLNSAFAPSPLLRTTPPVDGVTAADYPAQLCLVSGLHGYLCTHFANRTWRIITGDGTGVAVPEGALLYNVEPLLYNGDYILYN